MNRTLTVLRTPSPIGLDALARRRSGWERDGMRVVFCLRRLGMVAYSALTLKKARSVLLVVVTRN